MKILDQDPPVDLLWQRSSRYWTCRVLHASGLLSAESPVLEPEAVKGTHGSNQPWHGVFRAYSDPKILIVVGDAEVEAFLRHSRPPQEDDLVVDAMVDPSHLGCLFIGAELKIPDTSAWYHVARLFVPNISLDRQESPSGTDQHAEVHRGP